MKTISTILILAFAGICFSQNDWEGTYEIKPHPKHLSSISLYPDSTFTFTSIILEGTIWNYIYSGKVEFSTLGQLELCVNNQNILHKKWEEEEWTDLKDSKIPLRIYGNESKIIQVKLEDSKLLLDNRIYFKTTTPN